MRKFILGTVVLVAVIGFSGCASSSSENIKNSEVKKSTTIKYLTAEEVKKLYTGHTAYGKNLKYNSYLELAFSADGTYKGTIANGNKTVSGKWYVKSDGTKCNERSNAKDFCAKIYKENDYYVGVRDGKKLYKIKFK